MRSCRRFSWTSIWATRLVDAIPLRDQRVVDADHEQHDDGDDDQDDDQFHARSSTPGRAPGGSIASADPRGEAGALDQGPERGGR
jgi:hypothetical protein